MMIQQPPRSLESDSNFHRLKPSQSLQRSKVAFPKGHGRCRCSRVPSEEDTAPSSTDVRVPAERLDVAFLSLLGSVEHPIDVEILDPVLHVPRRRSGYGVFGVQSRVMDVDENPAGGVFVQERGDFAVDAAGGPQQGQLVGKRNVAVGLVSQFSGEVLKSEGCHGWWLDVRGVGRWENVH